jgi:hypothetical protein
MYRSKSESLPVKTQAATSLGASSGRLMPFSPDPFTVFYMLQDATRESFAL